MNSVFNSRYVFWLLLALPSIPMTMSLVSGGSAEEMLHPTGEFAARFMILAMIISPMRLLFPKNRFWLWLMRRRRYLGVAAFCYAFAHTLLYIVDMGTLADVLGEALLPGIWTGWVAMFIFIPLAITSNDWSVKRLGRKWKRLQQAVYIAAIFTLLHWIFVHNNVGPALVHFVPLAALELYRVWKIKGLQAFVTNKRANTH